MGKSRRGRAQTLQGSAGNLQKPAGTCGQLLPAGSCSSLRSSSGGPPPTPDPPTSCLLYTSPSPRD
eukprot:7434288-Alexandrium_andersonii.AAC.1